MDFFRRKKRNNKARKRSKLRRILTVQWLESRRHLAGDLFLSVDVNRDERVSSLDALQVINRIGDSEPSPEHDVNRDGSVSALDALVAINFVGRGQSYDDLPVASVTGPSLTRAEDVEFSVAFDSTNFHFSDVQMRMNVAQNESTRWQSGTATGVVVQGSAEGSYDADLRVKTTQNFWIDYVDVASGQVDRTPPHVQLQDLPSGGNTAHTPVVYTQVLVTDNFDGARSEQRTLKLQPGMNQVQETFTDAAGNVALLNAQIFSTAEAQSPVVKDQIDRNWRLFRVGVGVVGDTGLPIDSLNRSGIIADHFVSPAPAGFAGSVDTDIIAGFVEASDAERVAAVGRYSTYLDSIAQWQGDGNLLRWQISDANGEFSDQIDTANVFDNGVLLPNLIAQTGKLEASGFAETPDGVAITAKLDPIVEKVRNGMTALVSTATGSSLLHHAINEETGALSSTLLDNFGDEARAAIVDLYANGLIKRDSIPPIAVRDYVTNDGRKISVLGSGDGGSFQTFWPSQFYDDTTTAIGPLLTNTLIAHLDSAAVNGRQGFASASAFLGGDDYSYSGHIGVADIANVDNALMGAVGSLYSVPSAMQFLPDAVESFIEDVLSSNPGLRGSLATFDAIDDGEVVPYYVGVDVLSYVTGLSGGNVVGSREYYRTRNLDAAIEQLYADITPDFTHAPQAWPQPANPGAFTGIDLIDPQVYNPSQFGLGGNVTQYTDEIIRYQAGNQFGAWFGGKLPLVDQADNGTFLLRFRLANFESNTTINVKLELQGQPSPSIPVAIQSSDWVTVEIPLSSNVDVAIFELLPASAILEIRDAVFLQNPLTA